MDKNLDRTLVEALSWAGVRDLPPVDKGEDVYILALALVAKRDGSKSYVALQKDKNGEDRIKKDFGSSSQIVKTEAVYPYLYLDGSYLPDLKKKEDKVKWLTLMNTENKDVNYEEMTPKQLNKAILAVAIQNHLRDIRNRK